MVLSCSWMYTGNCMDRTSSRISIHESIPARLLLEILYVYSYDSWWNCLFVNDDPWFDGMERTIRLCDAQ